VAVRAGFRLCFSAALVFGLALPVPGAFALDLDLPTALRELKADLRWDPLSLTGTLAIGRHQVVFRAYDEQTSSLAVIDGREVLREPGPYLSAGGLLFPPAFISALGAALQNMPGAAGGDFRIAAVIVDPGHGGKDSGAVGTHVIDGKKITLKEKDITLQVALDLHARLVAAYPDKRVLLTRKADTFPRLEDRVEVANSVPLNEKEAIVFISIHANASFNKSARGYEVWYLSPEYRRTVIDRKDYSESEEVFPILNAMMEEEYTTESIMMARAIMTRFDQAIGARSPSRGIKAEEWFVVRNARMPSVLVELGFITNPEDARLLADQEYLRNLSEALYKGTVDFVATFERSGGFTTDR